MSVDAMSFVRPCLITSAVVGLVLMFAAGCTTAFWEDPAALQREQEHSRWLEERLRILTGRLETMEMEVQTLRQEIERSRTRSDTGAAARLKTLEERLDALERRLAESEAARERDRREIVDTLSRRMAELLQSAGGTSGRPSSVAPRGAREHEVRPGESLSSIAAAYNVRVADIMAANQLKDADRIRVGQKLIIPAP